MHESSIYTDEDYNDSMCARRLDHTLYWINGKTLDVEDFTEEMIPYIKQWALCHFEMRQIIVNATNYFQKHIQKRVSYASRRKLGRSVYLVNQLQQGKTLIASFNKKLPDMAVFDIKMPRMDGMDLLQRVRQKTAMPVIFLTSKDDEIDEVLGLRMGADDYVKKPFSQRLLVERIRALLRRQEVIAGDVEGGEVDQAQVMTRGELRMDPLRHSVTWKNRDVSLTVTEFLLLQALAQRPGFVKSRDQLMDVAYDDQVYVDDRTIDSHIKRLRKKMRMVDDEFSAIETLYGIGYRYNEE